MNTDTPPRPPLTPRLPGSAREMEFRIRSFYQGKKKRLPTLLLIPAILLIVLCGGMVSCRQTPPDGPQIAMATQYYDTEGNYIEIPALLPPEGQAEDEGVQAINQALGELASYYSPVLTGNPDLIPYSPWENQCLLYPTESDRYLNLVLFQQGYTTDLVSGHVTSLVYDKQETRQMTLEDALTLANQTEASLCQALSDQYAPELALQSQALTDSSAPDAYAQPCQLAILQPVVEGFRMDAAGQPIFYLTARVDDRDDAAADYVSGSENLYLWSEGGFTLYDQHVPEEQLQPLIPAEECLDFDPPLYRQWYFTGQKPQGGFTPLSSPALTQAQRAAFADALDTLLYQNLFPDGQLFDPFRPEDMNQNLFAVQDVDGDGKRELLLSCSTTYMAGMVEYILAWDEGTGTLRTQLLEFPTCSHYSNGVIQAFASHNQGLGGGDFWPYTLYRFVPETDSYEKTAIVDAWTGSLGETNLFFPGVTYPAEVDVSGTGTVYFVMDGQRENAVPMDAADYQGWLAEQLSGAWELEIAWRSLTEDSIQALRNGDYPAF